MSKRLVWGLIILLLWAVPLRAQDADAGYQEALRRIEEARVSGETALDLSFLHLTSLPPEIGQLDHLQVLNLTTNQLSSLPPEIGQLDNLQVLNLNINQLSSLPPEIGQISSLRLLELENNQLTGLPSEIGQLINLQQLSLLFNQLTTLPPEIGLLINLQNFYIGQNPIKTLPLEIGHLSQLVDFYGPQISFPPPEITSQGIPATLAYLRAYEAIQARQTIAGIATGVGGIAGVLLAFRWRQRRGLHEKKKRL